MQKKLTKIYRLSSNGVKADLRMEIVETSCCWERIDLKTTFNVWPLSNVVLYSSNDTFSFNTIFFTPLHFLISLAVFSGL